jgi:hypothetical protein
MDIYVDTEAVGKELEDISHTIYNINEHIISLGNNVARAGEDFTSINFYRIEGEAKAIANSLCEMNSKLVLAQDFLNKIIDVIDRYNKIRY